MISQMIVILKLEPASYVLNLSTYSISLEAYALKKAELRFVN